MSEPTDTPTCTCSPIRLNDGSDRVVGTNWSRTCPDHGTDSDWYATEGKAHLDAQNQRAIEMQKKAREARKQPKGDAYRDTY